MNFTITILRQILLKRFQFYRVTTLPQIDRWTKSLIGFPAPLTMILFNNTFFLTIP